MNNKNPALILLLVLVAVATVSCDKNPTNTSPQEQAKAITPASNQAASTQATPNPGASNQAALIQQAPAPTPRPSLAPLPVLTPDSASVQQAFAAALLATYNKTPSSPAREQWLRGEEAKLRTIQALSCTSSNPGTASVCQIRFNNTQAQIKLMLTQEGWRLVP